MAQPAVNGAPQPAVNRPPKPPTRGPARPGAAGFTLVELVVVITLIGLVASLGATLVGRVAAQQQGQRERLTTAQSADGALARVADELQAALPNSVRLTTNAAGVWVEWVPVQDGGRYRAAADTAAADPGDPLDLEDASDASFDVIGTALATPAAASQLVVQSLGTPEADAYAGNNRRSGLVLTGGGRRLAFTPAGALPSSTGSQRFFIVGTPLTLACTPDASGGTWSLWRYSGYGWQATQPASASHAAFTGANRALLLGGLAGCSAAYGSALANIGLLNLRLGLGTPGAGAASSYLQQLAIDNTP